MENTKNDFKLLPNDDNKNFKEIHIDNKIIEQLVEAHFNKKKYSKTIPLIHKNPSNKDLEDYLLKVFYHGNKHNSIMLDNNVKLYIDRLINQEKSRKDIFEHLYNLTKIGKQNDWKSILDLIEKFEPYGKNKENWNKNNKYYKKTKEKHIYTEDGKELIEQDIEDLFIGINDENNIKLCNLLFNYKENHEFNIHIPKDYIQLYLSLEIAIACKKRSSFDTMGKMYDRNDFGNITFSFCKALKIHDNLIKKEKSKKLEESIKQKETEESKFDDKAYNHFYREIRKLKAKRLENYFTGTKEANKEAYENKISDRNLRKQMGASVCNLFQVMSEWMYWFQSIFKSIISLNKVIINSMLSLFFKLKPSFSYIPWKEGFTGYKKYNTC